MCFIYDFVFLVLGVVIKFYSKEKNIVWEGL